MLSEFAFDLRCPQRNRTPNDAFVGTTRQVWSRCQTPRRLHFHLRDHPLPPLCCAVTGLVVYPGAGLAAGRSASQKETFEIDQLDRVASHTAVQCSQAADSFGLTCIKRKSLWGSIARLCPTSQCAPAAVPEGRAECELLGILR